MLRPHPRSTLFPYTTLFRSSPAQFPGGIPIGISDPAKSTMKKFLLVEEDLGLLWFTPTHLIYRGEDRKSTRLNSSHSQISYAVFCLKKKRTKRTHAVLTNN